MEILDFQAGVTLAASTNEKAFEQVATFNEQIGLVRLAVTVVDDLREAGHPDFQAGVVRHGPRRLMAGVPGGMAALHWPG